MQSYEFEDFGISEDIIQALDKLGYNKPTEIQSDVIPEALKGNDIIAESQTGSGKTAAFGVPICEKIMIEQREPQALILSPTRELCVQIKEDIDNIGRLKRVRCEAVYGMQPVSIQLRELRQRVHIIVGTPGRTIDLIKRGNLILDDVKYLVIDEADKMLSMGFIDQIVSIIKKLPSERMTMLFSATIPDEIESLCTKYMVNPVRINANPDKLITDKIHQVCYETDENNKFNLLKKIIAVDNPEGCILFCNTRENVEKLYGSMGKEKYSCKCLHGGMSQNDRLDVMDRFKKGEFTYLIATDLAARGIDIENLTHIINYDVPFEKESYVHRIGRTGRAGESGNAITFKCPYDDKYLKQIEDYIGYEIPKENEPSDAELKKAMKRNINNKRKPELKNDKNLKLNSDIIKIRINAGKKKKIRPGDIVGAVSGIGGINAEDIGIIDIQDTYSCFDILNGKGKMVLKALKSVTIKGKAVNARKSDI